MSAPSNAVWSLKVLAGTPALPVATVFVLPSPSGIVVANEDTIPLNLAPGGSGNFEARYYEVADDDASFAVFIDGTYSVLPLFTAASKTSSSRLTSTAEQTRSTSTATQTRVETSSVSVDTSATKTPLPDNGNSQGKKGVSTGVIAGIVLGVLLLLAVIMGIILLLLRRKKKQQAAEGIVPGEREGGESDKIVVEPADLKDNTRDYTELPGNSQVQELDPASREVATFRANETLGGNVQIDELHDGQHARPSHLSESSFLPADVLAPTSASASAPSAYVEAQKKVEISWLESEEAKLRQRREQLIMQSAEREP